MELSNKIMELGEKIEFIGNEIGEIGIAILPYSFIAYIFFRLLFHTLRIRFKYNHFVKSMWYLAHGLMVITNDISVDLIVAFIAFIEGADLLVKQLEEGREEKTAS